MSRAGAVAVWLVLLFAGARAETLTLATYNIENYGPSNRMTEAGYRKDYPKPEPEKRALRTVIRALNADVIVLQEMGPQAYLDELQRDLKSEGLDYPHAALASASDADRHVALLSRRPLKGVTTHTDLEFTYFGAKESVKRGLLEATVATAAGDVTIFAIHLKSRYTDRPDDVQSALRRTGEAGAVRDRILKRFPAPESARFVVLGDCNDTKASKALERLHQRGKTEIADLLPAADSRGEAWTHAFRKDDTYTRVDHILVSPGLLAAVQGRTARIFDGEGVRAASDHRPVMATLVLEAKK
ncbi:MAG: endonuclease/exonuclease/phosphatase family protein [Verrucomicrobia bacterium]|nr:endonuclease/exonuclease/phosphatase family protein [Verrucomicrobiota bacterium]